MAMDLLLLVEAQSDRINIAGVLRKCNDVVSNIAARLC
jgi:hypothetical protein